MRRIISLIIFIVTTFFMIIMIKGCVVNDYKYKKEIGSYWELADKSSTIEEKYKYITKFVNALKESKHSDYAAILFKTDTDSFDKNLQALISLKTRLRKMKTMDQNSFAYQTAMQQITAQEQGEANEMLAVFKSCYTLENCWYAYGVYSIIFIVFSVLYFWGCLVLFFIYLRFRMRVNESN